MGQGGVQPGAGRPKGSKTLPKLSNELTHKEKTALKNKALKLALAGDVKLLALFIEQIYGKARQNIGLDGGDELTPVLVKFLKDESPNNN